MSNKKQSFERFPELADHLRRMAVYGNTGSGEEWNSFLEELNKIAALIPAPQPTPDIREGEKPLTLEDIERAYCAGYINGAGANGSVIDAMADDKLLEAWERFRKSPYMTPAISSPAVHSSIDNYSEATVDLDLSQAIPTKEEREGEPVGEMQVREKYYKELKQPAPDQRKISDVRPWPLGAYAPGNYSCRCVQCQIQFWGDKRAVQCLECALKSNHQYISALQSEIKYYRQTLEEIVTACQPIKENPNVNYILKLADKALKPTE